MVSLPAKPVMRNREASSCDVSGSCLDFRSCITVGSRTASAFQIATKSSTNSKPATEFTESCVHFPARLAVVALTKQMCTQIACYTLSYAAQQRSMVSVEQVSHA